MKPIIIPLKLGWVRETDFTKLPDFLEKHGVSTVKAVDILQDWENCVTTYIRIWIFWIPLRKPKNTL